MIFLKIDDYCQLKNNVLPLNSLQSMYEVKTRIFSNKPFEINCIKVDFPEKLGPTMSKCPVGKKPFDVNFKRMHKESTNF